MPREGEASGEAEESRGRSATVTGNCCHQPVLPVLSAGARNISLGSHSPRFLFLLSILGNDRHIAMRAEQKSNGF